ncbi:MAG: DUF4912 domain-containing protein, partial [Candidatus Eisenbacteria bacterium]|nr:DUF4912 domain-containing protein [Candidatus Eisenbacteria bacterium]
MKRKELEKNTVKELRQMAQNVGLRGASRMRKAELVAHLADAARGETKKRAKPAKSKPSAKRAGNKATATAKKPAGKRTKKSAAKRKRATATARKSRPGRAGRTGAVAAEKPRKPAARKPRPAAKKPAARKTGAERRGKSRASSGTVISPWLKRTFSRVSGQGEQRAKISKYYLGVPESAELEERFEYPETYGENVISLMVRDPYWLFAYWEFAPELRDQLAA